MVQVEIKTGNHSMDYDINGSSRLVAETLRMVNVEEGTFQLWLMEKCKGSSFRKGLKFTSREKNLFHGTIQTGDNSSCFKINLIVPEEINGAHLFGALRKICDKVQKLAEQKAESRLPAPAKETPKRKQLFHSGKFFRDEDNRRLLSMYIQEALSLKNASDFSVIELRQLMIKQGFISEVVSVQSIWRLCCYGIQRNLFKKAEKIGKSVAYALTEVFAALGKKDGAIGTPSAQSAPADILEETASIGKLFLQLDHLSAMEKEKQKILEDTQEQLKEIVKEKEKIKDELKNIIDAK